MLHIKGMKHTAIISLLLLTGCGKSPEFGEFTPYVDSYVNEASKRGFDLSLSGVTISFGEMPSMAAVGKCLLKDSIRAITLREEWWNTADAEHREVVLYHELGHCVRWLLHRDDVLNIMNTYYLFPSGEYLNNRKHHLNVHFQR